MLIPGRPNPRGHTCKWHDIIVCFSRTGIVKALFPVSRKHREHVNLSDVLEWRYTPSDSTRKWFACTIQTEDDTHPNYFTSSKRTCSRQLRQNKNQAKFLQRISNPLRWCTQRSSNWGTKTGLHEISFMPMFFPGAYAVGYLEQNILLCFSEFILDSVHISLNNIRYNYVKNRQYVKRCVSLPKSTSRVSLGIFSYLTFSHISDEKQASV